MALLVAYVRSYAITDRLGMVGFVQRKGIRKSKIYVTRNEAESIAADMAANNVTLSERDTVAVIKSETIKLVIATTG